MGQRILRPDTMPSQVFLVLSGTVRLLAETPRGSRSLDRRGQGQLIGWVSLLRATPCEWVLASEETVLLGLPAKKFVDCLESNAAFFEALGKLRSVHEREAVLQQIGVADAQLASGWQDELEGIGNTDRVWTASAQAGVPFMPPDVVREGVVWLLSTAGVPGMAVGQVIRPGESLPSRSGFQLPYRLIGIEPAGVIKPTNNTIVVASDDVVQPFFESPGQSLEQLGILEGDNLVLEQRYPEVLGRGQLDEALAVCEMAALQQQVPFRRDAIEKVLELSFGE